MIAREVSNIARRDGQSLALVTSTGRWTYAELAKLAASAAQQLDKVDGRQVGVWCDQVHALLAVLIALDGLGLDAVLMPASATEEQVRKRAGELKLSVVAMNRDEVSGSKPDEFPEFRHLEFDNAKVSLTTPQTNAAAQVVLFTSGTSGQPKPVSHTWKTLSSGVNLDPKYAGKRWLLVYEPTAFAGIQVWLQALLTGGCVCAPETRDPGAIAKLLIQEKVEFASATPSFWRLLLHSVSEKELARSSLVQVTVGGEAVDQSILDALHVAFPKARLTHIYASTEMGVCFSVSDGKAGFPASFLSNASLPCQLRISDEGELKILSRRSMLGYIASQPRSEESESSNNFDRSGWFPTGDLVELQGDRVYFAGRKSDTINVGGAKVYPNDVERCISSVLGVEHVRVYGTASSLTGQLVAADVQPSAGIDRERLRNEILVACRGQLARHQIPAKITFCEQMPFSPSGKLVRSEALHGG
jgi:acyl-CoA synthetase (AMP-forming)/AMP-acid ligase II